MARDVPGTSGNYLTYGTDASVDDFATLTCSMWVIMDTQTTYQCLLGKQGFANGWYFSIEQSSAGSQFDFEYNHSTTRGVWNGTAAQGTGTMRHVAVTYDRGATTNNPVFYINGAVDTTNVTLAPVGTPNSDAALNLTSGQDLSFNLDRLDGRIQHVAYDSSIWTAAQVNRARWWGRPGGGTQVYHPMVTSKTGNEGAATADISVTGTVNMAAMATPVVRPGSGMGW